jgi:hypothetical protein
MNFMKFAKLFLIFGLTKYNTCGQHDLPKIYENAIPHLVAKCFIEHRSTFQ